MSHVTTNYDLFLIILLQDVRYIFQRQMPAKCIEVIKQLKQDEEYGAILIKHMLEENENLELFHYSYDILHDGLALSSKIKVS